MIRRCKEQDFLLLKKVFQRVYPSNPLLQKKAYFDWQFREHPFNEDGGYTLWLLLNDNEIVGFYGWVPVQVVYNGAVQTGCEPVCWWAEKNSKSEGLKLLNKIMNDYPIRLYHGCSDNSAKIFSAYSMPLYALERWVYILDVEKACSVLKVKDKKGLEDKVRNNCADEDGVASFSHIHALDSFQDEEEMMFNHWPSIKNHVRYTGRYLRWRYIDIPDHDYRVITSGKEGEYGIYRIQKIMGYDCSAVRIIEWSFGLSSWQNAIKFLKNAAMKEQAILIDFFCSSGEIGDRLQESGFVSNKVFPFDTIPRLFRPLYPQYTDLITCIDVPPYRNRDAVNFHDWYISKGNSDMDRKK